MKCRQEEAAVKLRISLFHLYSLCSFPMHPYTQLPPELTQFSQTLDTVHPNLASGVGTGLRDEPAEGVGCVCEMWE